MSYRFARIISIVFHPVLMPTYSVLLLFILSGYFRFVTTPPVRQAIFSIIVFNTFVMPLLIARLLYKWGYIKSIDMETREERTLPFLSGAILLLITYYLFRRLDFPLEISRIFLGAATAVTLALIINFKWKISIHMIGIGGVAGMLFGFSDLLEILSVDFRVPIMICLLIAGIIGVARLSLHSHRPLQLYAGFLLGFVSEYLILSPVFMK